MRLVSSTSHVQRGAWYDSNQSAEARMLTFIDYQQQELERLDNQVALAERILFFKEHDCNGSVDVTVEVRARLRERARLLRAWLADFRDACMSEDGTLQPHT